MLPSSWRKLNALGRAIKSGAPYWLFTAICLYGTGFIAAKAYYRYMPASWFLSLSQPAHISNASLGKPVTLTFCRQTRASNIQATGYRSFYRIVQGRELTDVDYSFKAMIEANKECQYPTITPAHLPKTAGTYKMHTDLVFSVQGNQKTYGYDLDEAFTISDTARSLQDQIDELQQQIKQLQLQQPQITSSVQSLQPAPATSVSPVQSTVATTPITVTTRPTTPPSSSPPDPSPAATPQPASNQRPLVSTLTDLTSGTVSSVQGLLSVIK